MAVEIEDVQRLEQLLPDDFDMESLIDECNGYSLSVAPVHFIEVIRNAGRPRLTEYRYGEIGHTSDVSHKARARRYGGAVDDVLRYWPAIMAAFDWKCAYCSSDSGLTKEHVEPLSAGGDHTVWNIVPACRRCNASKGKKSLEDWCHFKGADIEPIEVRLAEGRARFARRYEQMKARREAAVKRVTGA